MFPHSHNTTPSFGPPQSLRSPPRAKPPSSSSEAAAAAASTALASPSNSTFLSSKTSSVSKPAAKLPAQRARSSKPSDTLTSRASPKPSRRQEGPLAPSPWQPPSPPPLTPLTHASIPPTSSTPIP